MSFTSLPGDILLKIVKLVGVEGYQYLGPWLRAGREGRDMCIQMTYSRFAIFTGFVKTLPTFFPGKTDDHFFSGVWHILIQWLYVESLHLVVRDEDMAGAINLLDTSIPAYNNPTLGAALFCVCDGQGERATHYFKI